MMHSYRRLEKRTEKRTKLSMR